MRSRGPVRRVLAAVFAIVGAMGSASGCVGENEEEQEITCRIEPNTEACVCSRKEGGDKKTCTAADVDGACYGKGDYCTCRPWRCWGTNEPCSCEFGNAHVAHECTGLNCCFIADQNGGFCNCLDEVATCPGKKVTDCNFATIQPFLAESDGTLPRVEKCPL
jgi:hypothetical protein